MAKILAIKPVVTKAGRPSVLIQTATADIWVSHKQYQSKGCSNTFENYVGGDIEADYYKTGEPLFDGTPCTKDDTIVRDFSMSANSMVLASALAIESRLKAEEFSDKSALFARGRQAAKDALIALAAKKELADAASATAEGTVIA
jgi:hypothetical protein